MRGEDAITYQRIRESKSNVVSGTSTTGIQIDNQWASKSWKILVTPVTYARHWGTPKWLSEQTTKG